MKYAYIDTSWLIRVNLEDPNGKLRKKLATYDHLFSSELLVAELQSCAKRENLKPDVIAEQLALVTVLIPDRSIRPEIETVIRAGYVRGADLWHLACACYLAPKREDLRFLTADQRQQDVAKILGFRSEV